MEGEVLPLYANEACAGRRLIHALILFAESEESVEDRIVDCCNQRVSLFWSFLRFDLCSLCLKELEGRCSV